MNVPFGQRQPGYYVLSPGASLIFTIVLAAICACTTATMIRVREKLLLFQVNSWLWTLKPLIPGAVFGYGGWLFWGFSIVQRHSLGDVLSLAAYSILPLLPFPVYISIYYFLRYTDGYKISGRYVGNWILVWAWIPLLASISKIFVEGTRCYSNDRSPTLRGERQLQYFRICGHIAISVGLFSFSTAVQEKIDTNLDKWAWVVQPLVISVTFYIVSGFLRIVFASCMTDPVFYFACSYRTKRLLMGMCKIALQTSAVAFIVQSARFADSRTGDLRFEFVAVEEVYLTLLPFPLVSGVLAITFLLPFLKYWPQRRRRPMFFSTRFQPMDLPQISTDPQIAEIVASILATRRSNSFFSSDSDDDFAPQYSSRDAVIAAATAAVAARNSQIQPIPRSPGSVTGGLAPITNPSNIDTLSESSDGTLAPGTEFCIICYSKSISAAFLPCGHVCACSKCARRFRGLNCPICRTRVVSCAKLYFACNTALNPCVDVEKEPNSARSEGGVPIPGSITDIPVVPVVPEEEIAVVDAAGSHPNSARSQSGGPVVPPLLMPVRASFVSTASVLDSPRQLHQSSSSQQPEQELETNEPFLRTLSILERTRPDLRPELSPTLKNRDAAPLDFSVAELERSRGSSSAIESRDPRTPRTPLNRARRSLLEVV